MPEPLLRVSLKEAASESPVLNTGFQELAEFLPMHPALALRHPIHIKKSIQMIHFVLDHTGMKAHDPFFSLTTVCVKRFKHNPAVPPDFSPVPGDTKTGL